MRAKKCREKEMVGHIATIFFNNEDGTKVHTQFELVNLLKSMRQHKRYWKGKMLCADYSSPYGTQLYVFDVFNQTRVNSIAFPISLFLSSIQILSETNVMIRLIHIDRPGAKTRGKVIIWFPENGTTLEVQVRKKFKLMRLRNGILVLYYLISNRTEIIFIQNDQEIKRVQTETRIDTMIELDNGFITSCDAGLTVWKEDFLHLDL